MYQLSKQVVKIVFLAILDYAQTPIRRMAVSRIKMAVHMGIGREEFHLINLCPLRTHRLDDLVFTPSVVAHSGCIRRHKAHLHPRPASLKVRPAPETLVGMESSILFDAVLRDG